MQLSSLFDPALSACPTASCICLFVNHQIISSRRLELRPLAFSQMSLFVYSIPYSEASEAVPNRNPPIQATNKLLLALDAVCEDYNGRQALVCFRSIRSIHLYIAASTPSSGPGLTAHENKSAETGLLEPGTYPSLPTTACAALSSHIQGSGLLAVLTTWCY